MASLRLRWALVTIAAVAAFVGCWAGLHFGGGVAAGDALGWAILPFSVVSLPGGFWAGRVGKRSDRSVSPESDGNGPGKSRRVVQKQRATKNAKQLQVGRDIKVIKKND